MAELDLEKARIDLRILERGTDEIVVRTKQLAALRKSLQIETLAMQHKTAAFGAERAIYSAKKVSMYSQGDMVVTRRFRIIAHWKQRLSVPVSLMSLHTTCGKRLLLAY